MAGGQICDAHKSNCGGHFDDRASQEAEGNFQLDAF